MRTSNRFRSRDRTGRVAEGGRELREAERNQHRVGFFFLKKIGFRICIYKRPDVDPKLKIT